MSTILDALKKSEQERKLNKLPTLTDIPAPQEASRWPVIVGGVLVLLATALLVLAYVIWNSRLGEEEASNAAANVNESTRIGSSLTQSSSNLSEDSPIDWSSLLLRVDVVSYSTEPTQRFAMVNGKVVREGEFLQTGLIVEEILADTVVFNYRGQRIVRKP